MSIELRLRKCQKSLKYRHMALLWLKTSQARSGYAEYWKTAEFQDWVSEDEESGLMYYLAFEVNSAVCMLAQRLYATSSWAGMFGVSILTSTPASLDSLERTQREDILRVWPTRLRQLLSEVLVLNRAVELISEGYFDGHNVLFADMRREMASAYEKAKFLIVGYNYFASQQKEVPIDIDAIESAAENGVEQFLNEWVVLARSKTLAARGEVFAARDALVSWLQRD